MHRTISGIQASYHKYILCPSLGSLSPSACLWRRRQFELPRPSPSFLPCSLKFRRDCQIRASGLSVTSMTMSRNLRSKHEMTITSSRENWMSIQSTYEWMNLKKQCCRQHGKYVWPFSRRGCLDGQNTGLQEQVKQLEDFQHTERTPSCLAYVDHISFGVFVSKDSSIYSCHQYLLHQPGS